MIVSHHDNNYAGAVKSLNKVGLELAQIKSDTPPYVVAGLHQSELTFSNSKTLHKAYFGNLGATANAAARSKRRSAKPAEPQRPGKSIFARPATASAAAAAGQSSASNS